MKKQNVFWILLAILFLMATGCSTHSTSPTAPVENPDELTKGVDESKSRVLWGIWDLTFDPVSMEIEVQPSRKGMLHYDITSMLIPPGCNNCLEFIVNSFNPVTRMMVVTVTITNPTNMTGYDVRGILYTNDFGHRLRSSDGYTKKWDVPGGGSYNPFKIIEDSLNSGTIGPFGTGYAGYNVYIPKPPHYNGITFAIDASWPAHVKEPRKVTGPEYVNIYKGVGSKANFEVKAFDYDVDVNGVALETPLITGQASVPFTNIDADTWGLEFTNGAGPAPGIYEGVTKATSANSGAMGTFHVPELWVKHGFTNTWENGMEQFDVAVATDSSGNMFVGDYFSGTLDIDPGPGEVLLTALGKGDAFLIKYDPNGNLEWGYSFGTTSSLYNQTRAFGITTDNAGNVYMTGQFWDPLDFDPGPGIDLQGKLGGGAYLVKFDSAGNYQWAKVWGKNTVDYGGFAVGRGVVFDGNAGLYCVGDFSATVDFDPDPVQEENVSRLGKGDAYLLKLDTNGAFGWVRTWGGPGNTAIDRVWDVDVTGAGNPILCGWVFGPVDMDPGIDEDIFPDNGSSICAYSSGGVYLWGAVGAVDHLGIAVDPPGNSYIIGIFSGTRDLDPGIGVDEHTSIGWIDACLLKFDPDGTYVWGKSWGGVGDVWESVTYGYGISINDAGDSIACTGAVYPATDFDPGPGIVEHTPFGELDAYLSVFDPSGNLQWARSFGGLRVDFGSSVTQDSDNNIVSAGYYAGLVDFDPGPGKELHQGTNHDWRVDSFVTKFPPDGNW